MKKIRRLIEKPVESVALALASIAIFVMMVIEVLNAFGRKLFIPFPCCVETAEASMIVAVFLGIGYTALCEEHTQVTILTRRMHKAVRRYLDAAAYLFGTLIFGIWSYGAWRIAWRSFRMLEVRIGYYNFPEWVFRIVFALGLSLMTIQCILNALKFIGQASDPNWKPEDE